MNLSTVISRGGNKLRLMYLSKISSCFNRIKFIGQGVTFKGKASVLGHCIVSIHKSAIALIGENFMLSADQLCNPLNRSSACINVAKGAKLIIGCNVGMSSPVIWVRKSVTIGNNVNLGGGVTIMDSDAHSLNYMHRRYCESDMSDRVDKEIVIEDDVLVGAYSIILKGVHVGARSVIGAGSVVTKDIPADCIAAGNPARVIMNTRSPI
ncbi:MAG: acyltransferase [Prevotella sp.]|nr:acyltransferase [Prevotella sp.]